MMKKLMAAVVLTAVVSLPAFAAGDAAAGKNKAMTCVACHGMEGKVTVPMYPNLAGQNAMYLEQALKDYKSGGRSGGQGCVEASGAHGKCDGTVYPFEFAQIAHRDWNSA